MSEVGAYIEIPTWAVGPDAGDWSNYRLGSVNAKGPGGLDVTWMGDFEPPENARKYLTWTPQVIAVWNDEGEENGEDREDADGSNAVGGDEEVSTEPDLGFGEGGARDGDVPGAAPEGGSEEVE